MAMWRMIGQQETSHGEWSGSVQVPMFYVDTHSLSGAVSKAVDVLWEGRNPSGPLHLEIVECNSELHAVPGARIRSFTIVRDGDEMPEGRAVVCRLVLGRLDVAGARQEAS